MARKNKKPVFGRARNSEWETVSSGGFAPMWKPSTKGEDVICIPLTGRVIPKKGKRKESAVIECRLMGGGSESFFGAQDVKKGVANGEKFVIPLSNQLLGHLGTFEKHEVRLSTMSQYLLSVNKPLRIVFDGKIKGGQGHVKLFTVQAPPGTAQALATFTPRENAPVSGKKKKG